MADGDAGAAIRAAKAVARRWGVRDYRDLVAGAWLGVRAAAARGVVAGPMVAAAGRRGVIDLLRVEAPDGLKRTARGRGDRPPEQLGLTADAHAAPPATPDPQARLLECWGEHRGRRVWLPMRHRVAGYLRYVEGLTVTAVGECFGISLSWASLMLKEFADAVSGHGDAGPPGGEGEGAGGGGEGGGAGGPAQPAAGPAAPGGAAPDAPGGGGAGGDAGGVVRGGRALPAAGPGPDGRGAAGLPPGAGAAGVRGAGQAVGAAGPPGAGLVLAVPDAPRPPGRRSVAAAAAAVPAGVGRKAAVLREAVLDGIGSDDVRAVVAAVLKKAKAGDLRAAQVFLGIVGGGQ